MSIIFKCKSCGAFITFNPNDSNFKCEYCGTQYTEEEALKIASDLETKSQEHSNESSSQTEIVYNCSSCGAQIVTTETTAATKCYYCHSPIILSERLSKEYRPDKIIPFKFDKKSAKAKFDEYIKSKKYIPKAFFDKSTLDEFNGVYYPYWKSNINLHAEYNGKFSIVSSSYIRGNYKYTTVDNYQLYREADIKYSNIFRSALSKNQIKLAEGILPFYTIDAKDYSPAYLSGYIAERRDIDSKSIEQSVHSEVNSYIEQSILKDDEIGTTHGKALGNIKNTHIESIMLPTWVFTYTGPDKKIYYFSMNGQTGETCGNLPIDSSKLCIHSILIGLIIAIMLFIGGLFI